MIVLALMSWDMHFHCVWLRRAVLDEDTPGGGSFYCTPCARYFVSDTALVSHCKTKAHKRRYEWTNVFLREHQWAAC
jgi:hypothetical protein